MKSRWLWLAAIVGFAFPGSVQSQQAAPQNAEGSTPVITKETRLVLVDTVVTDKKGNYIRDLTQKDFKVWEDNKEQPIKTFSYEAGTAGPSGDQKHYLVLFFDNSDMNVGDQATARAAALKFLDSNTSPNRYIAIVNFGGTLQIAQNFTNDADRLKDKVRNLQFASVSPGGTSGPVVAQTPVAGMPAAAGIPQLASASAQFGVRTVLLALRNMAKGLGNVPGRKSLVFLSAGFPINQADSEMQAELMAAIDACNKSNVAIYPIDVRGVGNITQEDPLRIFPGWPQARLVSATLNLSGDDAQAAHLVYVQRGGAGGGGGTGGGHGGTAGGTGGAGAGRGTSSTGSTGSRGTAPSTGTTTSVLNAPYTASHNLIPSVTGAPGMQQVLYELAAGTGGFVIVNSNDLLGGLQKIAQEQNEYYVLGYTPPVSDEGSCHTLHVKVDRPDTVVRSRSGYCNVRPADLLAGKPVEKQLENDANGSQPGNVAATMLAPYFYVSPNVARVDLAIEIPATAIKFSKENGKQHAEINVLGLALKPDGTVAARFSDNVDLSFDSKEQMEEFAKKPYHYENQFEVGAGQYDLKVVFNSGGQSFGKMQMPLLIDTYDAKELSMSAVALSRELHPLNQAGVSLDADLLEDRTPLVAQGMEIVPTGSDNFKKTDVAVLYAEIYDPTLTAPNPADLRLHLQVTDRKTGEKKVDIGGPVPNAKAGNPVIPIGVRLPFDKLAPGSYQVEIKATDSAGNSTPVRTANFELE